MSDERRCWCGSEALVPFGERYLSCGDCETLVLAESGGGVEGWLERGYGREYWIRHQEANQRPNLFERGFADLPERCLHWLRAVLRHKLPPGRALELGCGHGGFVALMRWAGFDAMGLELDPWVVDFATSSFDVPVLRGPVEEQELEPGSFDLIVAMDVLEHLPDPVVTVGRCFELLSADGVLVVQTPRRPAGRSFEELSETEHRFLEMLLPDEHLSLFSEQGVVELLRRHGATAAFQPALFAHYDMFLLASRRPLTERTAQESRASLASAPTGRAVLALLDLDAERGSLSARLDTASTELEAGEVRQRQLDKLNQELTSRVASLESQGHGLRERTAELEELLAKQAESLAELRATQDYQIQRLQAMAPLASGESILPTSLNALFEGWSDPEGDGRWRWSDGPSASVVFRVGMSIAEATELLLEIEAGTYEAQVIDVWLNGVSVGQLRSEHHWEPSVYELVVGPQAIGADREQRSGPRCFELKVYIPGAKAVLDGDSERSIGLCLRRLTVRAV